MTDTAPFPEPLTPAESRALLDLIRAAQAVVATWKADGRYSPGMGALARALAQIENGTPDA
jgi:hypothetical protein